MKRRRHGFSKVSMAVRRPRKEGLRMNLNVNVDVRLDAAAMIRNAAVIALVILGFPN